MSRSSTEAEYRALAETAQEVTWLAQLLRDLNISQDSATLMLCDNLSAVYLTTNPALHKKSKHFDRDWHYIREQVALGLIETQHIPAELQIADIFTKALPRKAFIHLRSKLGVEETPTQSLREDVSVKAQPIMNEEAHLHQRSSPMLVLSSCRAEELGTASPQLRLIHNSVAPLLTSSIG